MFGGGLPMQWVLGLMCHFNFMNFEIGDYIWSPCRWYTLDGWRHLRPYLWMNWVSTMDFHTKKGMWDFFKYLGHQGD